MDTFPFLSQHARLITIDAESLLAERLKGREAVNELFRFEIDAVGASNALAPDDYLGEELGVTLLLADGSQRAWHGICTHCAWLGAARYRLRLEPALALLRLRRDSHIFQQMDTRAIVGELLADYPQVRYAFDLAQPLPTRAICTQYRETDLDFLVRLLAAEGLNFRFEHDEDGQTLRIFDSRAPADEGPAMRFHGVRAADDRDAIDQFSAVRRVRSNAVATCRWDPQQLIAHGAEQRSTLDAGELPPLSWFDASSEQAGALLQAFEQHNKQFHGAGSGRELAPGCSFALLQHHAYPPGDNQFVLTWIEHEARNNTDSALGGSTYRNRFGCQRDSVPMVPDAIAQRRPTSRGPHTALVVGLAGEALTSNRDQQVKVQFPWQRGEAPNAGGVLSDDGNAPGDARSGAWVRVAEALAGPNWGTQFTPRIGTEVLVDFIDGDIDQPVIVAQLHNGEDVPPFSAGIDANANHPGVLSGIHTQGIDGGGFNQWQTDVTAQQLRTRLATSSAGSEMSLGHLIEQFPGTSERGDYRGSGFELRTEASGVVRGGEGVLVTTAARSQQGSSVTSTQFDAAEAVAQLEGGIPEQESVVLLHAAAGMHWASAASTVLYAGKQLRWTSKADMQHTAGDAISSVAAGTTRFATHDGGIKAIAAKGTASLQAHAGQLEIVADQATTIVSVNGGIEIQAKQKIVLQAGQSAITLEGGDIRFACPGTLSVKGAQHLFDGPIKVSVSLARLPTDA